MSIFLSLYKFIFYLKLPTHLLALFSLCKPQFVNSCMRVKPCLYLCAVWAQTIEVRQSMTGSSSSGALRLHPFPALQNPVLSKSWTELDRSHLMEGTKPLAPLGFPVAGDMEPIH